MNNLPNVGEMAASLAAEKAKNGYKGKIYKAQSDAHKGEQLSDHIHAGSETLKESLTRPKINLHETEAVQRRVFEYLEACEIAQVFPSVMGLSSAFGLTRQAVNQWMLANHSHATTDFIRRFKDIYRLTT